MRKVEEGLTEDRVVDHLPCDIERSCRSQCKSQERRTAISLFQPQLTFLMAAWLLVVVEIGDVEMNRAHKRDVSVPEVANIHSLA